MVGNIARHSGHHSADTAHHNRCRPHLEVCCSLFNRVVIIFKVFQQQIYFVNICSLSATSV